MAIPVAMQTALLLLNHLNENVFPFLYPHSLSVHSLIPKKNCTGGDFTHMSDHFFSSDGGKKGTIIIKLQKAICIDRMAEMDDGFRLREIFQWKKKIPRDFEG